MLSGVSITREFWLEAEVVDTTKYLVNRSPSSLLVNLAPHEVWFGKNHLLSYLKVFGYDEFFHVPKEKKRNLDKKVVKCVFIGYKDGMKAYKLWDPTSRKIMYSRDVVFEEVNGTSEFGEFHMEK
jgi:hypothetical protein